MHNETPRDFCLFPNSISVIREKKKRLVEGVAQIGGKRKAWRILEGNSNGKTAL